ncbi:uncharacterized protein LOC113299215 isoform X1 [Papaver somniferum]|uniref:uncharacterized protein LOC113299215 isoform X1 n=1 Tax=Papaver somniferum TaxID=3469 RepID=UPI000E6FA651|nr:uncharacterized protein LOC113299215 isoform X1 [Papaver somniferum]
MPRSSRHKQHKQSKHSSKDVRERSDSEEDVNLKSRNGGDDNMVRVSRDMASGEKRRHSQDGNVDFSEDYVASKRRKEGVDLTDNSDRWKGVEEDRRKKEKIDPETFTKIKALVDSSSHKSSRRNESLKKENNAVIESDEVQKIGCIKTEIKYKSEKDSRRKEVYEYKEGKERGADKERKVRDSKKEILIDAVPGRGSEDGESGRKRGSQSLHVEEVRSRKREVETDDWQVQDDVRNPDLEKEYDKRVRRRRDGSVDKDKYQDDISECNNKYFSSKDDRTKSGQDKDERSGRDKSKDDLYRDKYREDVNRDHRRDDKYRDDLSSRDHSDRYDTRHFRDDSKTEENRIKRSRPHDPEPDGSSHHDEVGIKYKDVKEKKRIMKENEGHHGIKSPNSVERRADMEKKPSSGSRLSSVAERGRSQSRHLDVDFNVSTSKWNTSPSSNVHAVKDQYRYNAKQAESKYRDTVSEERFRTNVASSRDLTGPSGALERTSERISLEKPIQKDENYVRQMPNERPRRSDALPSPKLIIEKSPSSSSYDCRYSNKSTLRRSLDVEEAGGRSIGAKDVRDLSANEERRIRDLPSEKPSVDDFSQPDGDTSSVNRSGHFLGNPSSSLLPPPPPSLRTVVVSPSVMEEDSRGKLNNRYRRYGDPNAGRGLGNAWKGLPSWPSPVTNGFIPYPHGPPPGRFHPLMQQFPAHFFGVRPAMDLNHSGLPYIPDVDRFSSHGRSYVWRNPDGPFPSHLQGWDGSNRVLGDEAQMYGMPDWDQNRHPLGSRGWETNAELGKGQKISVNMELPSAASQKEDHPQLVSSEASAGPSDQQPQNESNRPGSFQEESIEVNEFNAHAKNVSPEVPRSIRNVADEGAPQFCGVYLCKLDTSVDLCHPELYDNCISLLEDKGASVSNDTEGHDYMEERVQSGVRISNAIKSASFFSKIDESIFQRAIGFYRKQADEMKVIQRCTPFPTLKDLEDPTYVREKLEQIPTTDEEEDLTAEGENLEHIPTNEEEELKLVSAMEAKVPESVSTTDQVQLEPVPFMKLEKLETVPTIDNGELQPVPNTGHDMLEPISASLEENVNLVTITEEKKRQPRGSCTADEEMQEPGSAFGFESLEPGVASDQDMMELLPTPKLDKSEKHTPNLNLENLEDQVLAPKQEKLEVAISESAEEMGPTSFQDIMEEEPSTCDPNMEPCAVLVKKEQEPDTTSIQETAEPILEKAKEEVVVSDRSSIHGQSSLATTEYPFIEEEIVRVSSCEGSHVPLEQKSFTNANCGSPSTGFIAGSSEGCESPLMPESIECRLVSLSRIHNFSENTH